MRCFNLEDLHQSLNSLVSCAKHMHGVLEYDAFVHTYMSCMSSFLISYIIRTGTHTEFSQ